MEIVDYDVLKYFEDRGYTIEKAMETKGRNFYIIKKEGKQRTLDIFEYPDQNRSIWKEEYQRLKKGGIFAYTKLGRSGDKSIAYIYTKKDIESKHQTWFVFWKKDENE